MSCCSAEEPIRLPIDMQKQSEVLRVSKYFDKWLKYSLLFVWITPMWITDSVAVGNIDCNFWQTSSKIPLYDNWMTTFMFYSPQMMCRNNNIIVRIPVSLKVPFPKIEQQLLLRLCDLSCWIRSKNVHYDRWQHRCACESRLH